MRYCISLLIIVILFTANSWAQRPNIKIVSHDNFENEREIVSKNHIKNEVIYVCTKKDSTPAIVRRYDSSGRLVKESSFYDRGLIRDDTFMFNDKGQLVRKFTYQYGDKTWNNEEFEYDSAGNQILRIYYNKDTTYLTMERKKYNEKHQLIELRSKINSGDFYTSQKNYYNEKGSLEKADALDTKGELIYSYLYEYDDRGNLIAIYLENQNGKVKSEERTYNKSNQLTKIQYFSTHTIVAIGGPIVNLSEGSTRAYTYNPDGTVYQFSGNSYDIKSIERHYYYYY